MIQSKAKKNTGESGLANVQERGNGLSVTFLGNKETYSVSNEFGDGVWERGSGNFHITLDKQNDKIKFVGPAPRPDAYLVKFQQFANRGQSGIPEAKIRQGGPRTRRDGQQYFVPDALMFTAKLVVIEKGIYEGLTINHAIPYVFAPADGNPAVTQLNGTGAENKKVADFLQLMGMNLLTEDIPFSVNVLPWLEGRFLHSAKILTVKLNENGYIDTIASLPDYMIPAELLGKSASKSKPTATKKVAAKKTPAKVR